MESILKVNPFTFRSQIDNHQLVPGEFHRHLHFSSVLPHWHHHLHHQLLQLCHQLHYLQHCIIMTLTIIILNVTNTLTSAVIILLTILILPQVPLNLITATTLMLVKSGQLEDRGLVFGLLSFFLLLAAIVAASIETKEEKRE